MSIEVSGSVTALAFHPHNPVILAGGTSLGEIYLWSVFDEEPRICSSIVDEYFHRESVTKLLWLSEPVPGHIEQAYVTRLTLESSQHLPRWQDPFMARVR